MRRDYAVMMVRVAAGLTKMEDEILSHYVWGSVEAVGKAC